MSLDLWVPRPDATPNIDNLFDMMLVMQEVIDVQKSREAKIRHAFFAVRALDACLRQSSETRDNLTVVTKLAVVDSVEEEQAGLVVENVGLHSQLDSVNFTSIPPYVPGSLTLGLDVEAMYKASNPTETDLILRGATVPIDQIEYIETA